MNQSRSDSPSLASSRSGWPALDSERHSWERLASTLWASVERALRDAYKYSFDASDSEAAEAIAMAIPIVKVHGSLGDLVDEPSDHGRVYRPSPKTHLVKQAADNIIVLHEGEESSEEFEQARHLIKSAQRVICLGCAYHWTNMSRLHLNTGQSGSRIGSGFGLTDLETRLVKGRHGIKVGDPSWRSVRFLRETIDLG